MEEGLSFDAILVDAISGPLEVIAAALESVAEVMGQVTEAISTGMAESAAATGELQVAVNGLAVNMDAAAASTDAATAAADANTASTDANTASKDANAAAQKRVVEGSKALLMPLGLAAAAMVGIGAVAVHMAGDFEEGLTTLVTGAGESASNLGMIHDGVLNMSVATGESTKQLTDGLFMIESAGHHGADALNVLQAAAEGAKVGAADLGVVADGTTTIMTDFSNTHITAAQAVNAMIATVASGKTHMQDLSAALAQILPTASSAGISLKDVMGAMATMTGEGVPAANAATYLRQTIIALEAPSKQTTDALASVGLKSSDVAAEMKKSLPDALKMITDAVGKKFPEGSAGYVEAMKQISGGSKQMQGMLDLTGQHMGTYQTNVKGISDATTKGGNSIQGWSLVQKDFNQQLSVAGATLQVMMIKLGEALMPVATALVQHLQPALQWLTTHGPQVGQALGVIAVILGGALLGALVGVAPALGAAAVAWWGLNGAAIAAVAPFIAIGIGIALLAVGLKLAYDHIKPFRDAVDAAGKILGQIAGTIKSDLAPVFTKLGGQLKSELLPAWNNIHSAFVTVQPVLKMVAAVIGGVLVTAVGLLIGIFTGLIEGFAAVLGGVARFVGGLVQAITGVVKLIVDLWAGFFTILKDLFSGNWSKLGSDAKAWGMTLWHDLVSIVTGLWNAIQGVFQVFIGGTLGFIHGFVTGIVGFFTGLWDTLVRHSIIPDMINGIVDWFKSLPARAIAEVRMLAAMVVVEFDALATRATQWGTNLVQNFINGIKNMAGAVGNAASNIAGTIKNFLGFASPAAMGPGAEADRWMPNLTKMLAAGLEAHAPLVATAASHVAGAMAGALNTPGALASGGGSFPAAMLASGGASGLGGGGPLQITVILKDETGGSGFIAGTRMLNPDVRLAMAREIAQEMQAQGLLQGRQPIGYTGGR